MPIASFLAGPQASSDTLSSNHAIVVRISPLEMEGIEPSTLGLRSDALPN